MSTHSHRFALHGVLAVLTVTTGCSTLVSNPDYRRWALYEPGASVTMEGYQAIDGERQPVRVTAKLVSSDADRIVLERTYVQTDAPAGQGARVQEFVEPKKIDPADHPLTHPDARRTDLPPAEVTIGGRTFTCDVLELIVTAKFEDWGENVSVLAYLCPEIPGGLAEISMRSSTPDQQFEFSGKVVEFTASAE